MIRCRVDRPVGARTLPTRGAGPAHPGSAARGVSPCGRRAGRTRIRRPASPADTPRIHARAHPRSSRRAAPPDVHLASTSPRTCGVPRNGPPLLLGVPTETRWLGTGVLAARRPERVRHDSFVAQAVTRPVGAGVIAFLSSSRGASARRSLAAVHFGRHVSLTQHASSSEKRQWRAVCGCPGRGLRSPRDCNPGPTACEGDREFRQ